MKRLTYAPRAYVFIRSRTDNKVYDVSDLVTGGNVQRNMNMPSTAEITLKNKDFILSPRRSKPRFLPMDGITIWLQRIAGYPIQVFTGYLDSVPYYQMYPGNATITATCTLKRLMHTYFDPGVPQMMEWFSKYGWRVDPKSGMTINMDELVGRGNVGHKPGSDGGFGSLLYNFLIEICGWDSRSILIGDLPKELPSQAAKIWHQIEEQEQIVEKQFVDFMKKLMTVRVEHKAGEADETGVIVNKIYKTAGEGNIDPTVLIMAAISLSGLDPTFYDSDTTSRTYGAGLYAIPSKSKSEGFVEVYDGNRTLEDMFDPVTSTQVMIRRLREAGKPLTMLANDKALSEWIAAATGKESSRAALEASLSDNREAAKQLASTYGKQTNATTVPATRGTSFSSYINEVMPDRISWDGILDDKEKSALNYYPSNIKNHARLPDYAFVAHKYNMSLYFQDFGTRVNNPVVGGDLVMFKGSDTDDMESYVREFAGKAKGASRVIYISDTEALSYANGEKATGDRAALIAEGYRPFIVYVKAAENSERPRYVGKIAGDVLTAGTEQDGGRVKFQDIAQLSFNAAFTAQFQLPIDFIRSMFLSGDKSIMNDIPVLNGVKDMAAASLRTFMSLPNGDFAAFYPDYFGAQGRKAYWQIPDIEIVDMGIQLSDDPLTTHVFVTGATYMPGQINWINELLTQGVVTLDKVFLANNFIANEAQSARMDAQAALDFLNVYGARPLTRPMPTIRSHWFEFLYALQLFMYQWAAQYQTRVQFTFQPEVMCAGRISFPEHNLEMFVERVQHTWNYEGGFETNATLVAPATTDKKEFPGFALAGQIGGFGAISTGGPS